MRTYTESELLKAIEYACGYQKASDYQTAGEYLIDEKPNIVKVLDELSETDKTAASEITIEDLNEHIYG